MYFYVTTAKRARINHYARQRDWYVGEPDNSKYRTIKKGDKCLVFSNGTIGQGAIRYNYAKKDAIKMLKELIKELES